MSPYLRVRIVVDRAVAALLLVPVAPLVALLGWLVHRHDGGPALIAVPRIGRDGRPLRMWKLRTMRVETSDGRARGAALTADRDGRITPPGRRLRALHLDELPQLYHVVRGEMALLGPRPEAPEFVDRADPRWTSVLAAPPGLAGPTQLVVGAWERAHITASPDGRRYVEDVLPVKLAIDGWYVRTASPGLDAIVLFDLVARVLPGDVGLRLAASVRREVPEARALAT